MLYPSLFKILNNSPQVKLLLGSNPLRVYPSNRAAQNSPRPYAVYSVYNGVPENYLGDNPDIDNKGTQITIFADTTDSLEKCYEIVRNTLQPHAYMPNYSTDDVDTETDLFSVRMEFDFWDER